MTRSMTGFARKDTSATWGELALEIRAVNHRFLELSLRMPEELRSLDPQIRKIAGKQLSRGKLDINFKLSTLGTVREEIQVNPDLLKMLIAKSQDIAGQIGSEPPNAMDLLRWPGVVVESERDTKTLQAAAMTLLKEGLKDLIQTRESEGARLRDMLLERCEQISGFVTQVREHLPEVRQAIRDKLHARLDALDVSADEGRLETEIALLLNKADVAEELDRLDSHVLETKKALQSKDAVGRRLDFLMQEFNREANTLASKSQDAETTRISLELKVLIEQMREQVQNIE